MQIKSLHANETWEELTAQLLLGKLPLSHQLTEAATWKNLSFSELLGSGGRA